MIEGLFRVENDFIEILIVFFKCFQVKINEKYVFGVQKSDFQSLLIIRKLFGRKHVIYHSLRPVTNLEGKKNYSMGFLWLAICIGLAIFFLFKY